MFFIWIAVLLLTLFLYSRVGFYGRAAMCFAFVALNMYAIGVFVRTGAWPLIFLAVLVIIMNITALVQNISAARALDEEGDEVK